MINQLSVVHQQNVLGQEFKVYGTVEEPLFLAKDVADWIEYDGRTGQLLRTVDEEEKLMNTIYASGQNRDMWFLTEDGIYEVLMQSRKPIAKAFKKEVKKILKQIRLTGGTVQEDREAEFIENYFPSFSEDVKKMMVLDLRELYLDSLEVAEMTGKLHKNLIRDIDSYMSVLGQSSTLSPDSFFVESSYTAGTGKSYKCYLLTRKGCDMVANKMTGEKGILFTATYVTRFEEMEN